MYVSHTLFSATAEHSSESGKWINIKETSILIGTMVNGSSGKGGYWDQEDSLLDVNHGTQLLACYNNSNLLHILSQVTIM